MKVPFVNLGAQFESLKTELVDTFVRVGSSGQYILGPEVECFEAGLANITDTKYAIAVANGTDALELVLAAWGIGPGDEVITAPNSFIASAGAVKAVGANVVFADVGEDYNIDPLEIEKKITPKTKVIIPVHLTGNPANMTAINAIAKRHQLKVLEDAAQAIGATHKGRAVGGLGDAAAFSLHPLKNFHLCGDAGFISTNDKALYEQICLLRNHGLVNRDESIRWGRNSRIDALQAAIGNVKLPYFAKWTERFKQIASRYHQRLNKVVECPKVSGEDCAVYHNFVIQVDRREALMAHLLEKGVESKIHYPIPLHLMRSARKFGYREGDFPVTERQRDRILSLPIYPELTDSQVDYVCDVICAFYEAAQ
ncbi:hypothetical protein KUL42_07910 [Alteromonas sp. KUL42]|uniref:DegT/DnrJ/EryC1/StrS family aminotransferase n=1 Tax=Alteromonas sp. KUL42 TaxID=2480797 RepID=UPI001035ADFA|nr:DegT/DnrJ/EryC1/StrS family aminotransferase [Alteromonas sp. KUL42]TAP37599.1 DegT/DnrJ/EryC1/StrS family aminotransferase [Alteromonas sp. KUL42]GEA06030.1 hypothetical protein KUL42_07910 [Alteromonas sp. KUL42]